MIRSVCLCTFLVATTTSARAEVPVYDVVVYGGTPGGVTAAVAAARHGAEVLLLEQKQHVGGLTTSGLCNDEVHHMAAWTISGLSLEFYQRLARQGGRPDPREVWAAGKGMNTWHSSVAQQVFDAMLEEAKVPVRYGQRVEKVVKQGPHIGQLVMLDGTVIPGRVFIDCTYEGDLMARSGVDYTWGRESQEKYGESLAGIRLVDKVVDARTVDQEGKLLPGISGWAKDLAPGAADRKVQNCNFRLTIAKDRDKKVPFPKPSNYDPGRYALLADYLKQHPDTVLKEVVAYWYIGGGKFECNNHQNAVISLGHFGGQFDYPDADYDGQDRIYQDHVDYTQGLFWFLGHDEAVPEPLRKQTLEWGLAKDEFADNGNWPYYLYIREARRMIGPYVMTEKDIREDRRKPDSIGLGSHYIDSHHVQRLAVSESQFTNEGRLWMPGRVYEIPYRSITPKAEQCDNLLVPVAASFSHVAFCPFRLEPTWMAAGHSAGVAATLAAKSDQPVQEVDVAQLQNTLKSDGLLLFLSDEPRTDGEHVCLVDGNRADGELFFDASGARFYACCPQCLEKIAQGGGYLRLPQETGRQPEQVPINRSRDRDQREVLANMVLIAGGEMQRPGTFLDRRGRTPEPVEHEPYTVRISPFYIDKYEVTYADYCEFVNDRNEKYATGWISQGDDGTFVPPRPEWARFPVRGASYFHARGYADWAGKRLPTEAEWEFAHGGSERRTYPWGNDELDETRANYGPTLGGLKPVGSFPKGQTPEGVFDLAGNIGEWCADFYDEEYYRTPSTEKLVVDPQGPKRGFDRVYRLGCQCKTSTPKDLHGNLRCHATPFRGAGCVGFRCARSVLPTD